MLTTDHNAVTVTVEPSVDAVIEYARAVAGYPSDPCIVNLHAPAASVTVSFGTHAGCWHHHDGAPATPTPPPDHSATDHPRPAEAPQESRAAFRARERAVRAATEAGIASAREAAIAYHGGALTSSELRIAEAAAYHAIRAFIASQNAATQAPATPEGESDPTHEQELAAFSTALARAEDLAMEQAGENKWLRARLVAAKADIAMLIQKATDAVADERGRGGVDE